MEKEKSNESALGIGFFGYAAKRMMFYVFFVRINLTNGL
jgi:hypothetical protein